MESETVQGFDITEAAPKEYIEHELVTLSGKPTGLVFKLLNPYHEKLKAFNKHRANKLFKTQSKRSEIDIHKETLDRLLVAVVGWRFKPGASIGGKTPDYTKQAFTELVSMDGMWWIADQLSDACREDSDFFEQ